MKTTYFILILLFTSNIGFAQTKQIANESLGLTASTMSKQKDDFGVPGPQRITDTVKIVNDSCYVEFYHWTHATWHNGEPIGCDTLLLRSNDPMFQLYIYSNEFATNFDNRFHSGNKAVILYPKKSEKKQKKANEITYPEEKASKVNYVRKGNVPYLFTFILILGGCYWLVNRRVVA